MSVRWRFKGTQQGGPGREALVLAAVAAALIALIGLEEEFYASPQGAPALKLRPIFAAPHYTRVPEGVDSNTLVLKLRQGAPVRIREGALALQGVPPKNTKAEFEELQAVLNRHGVQGARRLFTRSEDQLEREREEGQRRTGRELGDLNLYFTLAIGSLPERVKLELINALNRCRLVETVYFQPVPLPARQEADFLFGEPGEPSIGAPDEPGDYEAMQGFLDAAPQGIDARHAWTVPGGTGAGVTIADVEGGWNYFHREFKPSVFTIGGSSTDCSGVNWFDHGTAVLGVIISKRDGTGVTGIAYDSAYGTSSLLAAPVAVAVNNAAAQLLPGDVMLVETQYGPPIGWSVADCGCSGSQCGSVPVEYYQADFDAVSTASALGVTVVLAAGNGSSDLDNAFFEGRFNVNVRDSGAVLTGAGDPSDRSPRCFTNFGARVDVQGWGGGVTTTGYGLLYPGDCNGTFCSACDKSELNSWYTKGFAGTSAASVIVAGACASLQGAAMAKTGVPLEPAVLRALLADTGTPQASSPKHIGPLPDLKAAMEFLCDNVLSSSGLLAVDGVSCGAESVISNTRPVLAWSAVAGAAGYEWEIWTGAACKGIKVAGGSTDSKTTSVQPPASLADGNYHWRVRARGTGAGVCDSPWNCGCSFTVDTAASSAPPWQRTLGSSDKDEIAYAVLPLADGGMLVGGSREVVQNGPYNGWLARFNSKGDMLWQRSFGTQAWHDLRHLAASPDGNFFAAGYAYSDPNVNVFDMWVFKFDGAGAMLWQRYLGMAPFDYAYGVAAAGDGGIVAAGQSQPTPGQPYDAVLVKLDSNGNLEWKKAFDAGRDDYFRTVSAAPDGGFLAAGGSNSRGAGTYYDGFSVKVDANGDVLWWRFYGGATHDWLYASAPARDGGYFLAGQTDSFGRGQAEMWVLKVSALGVIEWQKAYGAAQNDIARAVWSTLGGGLLVAGHTDSFSGNPSHNDMMLLKLDGAGAVQWQKHFGGAANDWAYAVCEFPDRSIGLAGSTSSFGAGHSDAFMARLSRTGAAESPCFTFQTGSLLATTGSMSAVFAEVAAADWQGALSAGTADAVAQPSTLQDPCLGGGTSCTPLAQPSLVSPAGSFESTLTPPLRWNDVSGEAGYVVSLFAGSGCTALIHNSEPLGAGVSSYDVPGGILSDGQTYSWQVRALGDGLLTCDGTPSSCGDFEVRTECRPLPPPVPVSPADSTTGTSTPVLTWVDVKGETGYSVLVFKGLDCVTPIHTSPPLAANTTFYTVPSGTLSSGQTYQWQVRALGDGLWYCHSDVSSCTAFAVDTDCLPLQAPQPVSPVDVSLNTLTPVLTWEDVDGESAYRVRIFDGPSCATMIHASPLLAPGSRSYELPSNLLLDVRQYSWQVMAVGASSFCDSTPSLCAPFRVNSVCTPLESPLQTGVDASPCGEIIRAFGGRATLLWSGVAGASGYRWEVFSGDSCAPEIPDASGETAPGQLSAAVLLANGEYVWRVRALSPSEECHSSWTCGCAFSVLSDCPPPSGCVPAELTVAVDSNCDGCVDGRDLGFVGRSFGLFCGDELFQPDADLNGDGVVDGSELDAVVLNFGRGCG